MSAYRDSMKQWIKVTELRDGEMVTALRNKDKASPLIYTGSYQVKTQDGGDVGLLFSVGIISIRYWDEAEVDRQDAAQQVTRDYDGLTAEVCYKRYCENMDETSDRAKRYWTLTPSQKLVAQVMWAAKLQEHRDAQKVTDAGTRTTVLVEIDDE